MDNITFINDIAKGDIYAICNMCKADIRWCVSNNVCGRCPKCNASFGEQCARCNGIICIKCRCNKCETFVCYCHVNCNNKQMKLRPIYYSDSANDKMSDDIDNLVDDVINMDINCNMMDDHICI